MTSISAKAEETKLRLLVLTSMFPRWKVDVEPGNAGALADAILKTLHAPDCARSEFGAIRKRVMKQTDWSAVTAQYLDLLNKANQSVRGGKGTADHRA